MRDKDNVTVGTRVTRGLVLGTIGVVAFSMSLPATRAAVADLDPFFVAFGRAAGAAVLALGYLWLVRAPRPTRAQLGRLALVSLGVVLGFPLLTSFAMVTQTSAHGAVVIACMPLATAVLAVFRAGERPHGEFWVAGGLGLLAVLAFIVLAGGAGGGLNAADLFLLGAVLLGALGYAEGGVLARELGGARTICWALVITLPLTLPGTLLTAGTADGIAGFGAVGVEAWLGFGYVTLVSTLLGFFAWYAGLARGGVAKIGQVQLLQPVLTLGWSALLLGEHVSALAVVAATAVLGCVVWTQRARRPAVRAVPALSEG